MVETHWFGDGPDSDGAGVHGHVSAVTSPQRMVVLLSGPPAPLLCFPVTALISLVPAVFSEDAGYSTCPAPDTGIQIRAGSRHMHGQRGRNIKHQ